MKNFSLLTTLYNEKDTNRRQEYISCLEKNIRDPNIDSIIVFYEKEADNDYIYRWLQQNTIIIKLIDRKPTFHDLFEYSNRNLRSRKIIISNADIYFDEEAGLNLLSNFSLTGKFLVLTRYNKMVHLSKLLNEYPQQTGITIETKDGVLRSQHLNGSSVDSWIFKTPLVLDFKSNYTLGRVSCDSCLNHQLKKSKFVSVYNPCRDVISIHEHNDWTPAKYQAVVDEQGVKRTLNEWTRHNLSNGDFLECIPFCSLADIG